jgi:sugar phosphate isomerase/epimerase
MRRRELLGAAAMCGLAGALGGRAALAAPASRRTLGLQLYTVLVPLEQDFDGTLQAVANIGYREVETIGSFGRDPKHVRELLDRYGLKSPSQHLVPGNLYEVFNAFAAKRMSRDEIHQRWLSGMSVDRVIPIIEEGIARAKILGQTVKLEMDVYWAVAAQADPIAYFTRYPDRYRQCHLKDGDGKGELAPAGKGVVDFPKILKAARQAGIEHYYFEYDRSDDPMAVTRQSFEYLRKFF